MLSRGRESRDRQPTTTEVVGEPRGSRPTVAKVLMASLVVALIAAVAVVVAENGPMWRTRYDAWAAARSLSEGDVESLGRVLADRRGDPEFAFHFASRVTPRQLGDGIATVAGTSTERPLRSDVEARAYAVTLTDLAGTVALATHGSGARALPPGWTSDFITATIDPTALYGGREGFFDREGMRREKQDEANRSHLLLLLSRGYWSEEFLQSVTTEFYEFDRREGSDAWPEPDPGDDAGWAPSPDGAYLTDGVLALTSALTANPEASAWVFTEFEPGKVRIDGSEEHVSAFTHFLMFEHEFPESSDGERVGMTATLTALSAAIDSMSWATEPATGVAVFTPPPDAGPEHDLSVLRTLAGDLRQDSDCSWSPMDYGRCAVDAGTAILRWVGRWGHRVLDILTLATFAPPPFSIVGVGAATTNATWHAVEGDFSSAGLSLAAAVPGLAFTKIARGAKAGRASRTTDVHSVEIARAAKQMRGGLPVAATRPSLTSATKERIRVSAPRAADGNFIDPNTKKRIPRSGPFDYGHRPGFEWRCIQAKAARDRSTRAQLNTFYNNPSIYQIEDPSSNRSHLYEGKSCARSLR